MSRGVLGMIRLAGVLALVAGFLMVTGGFSSHSFLLDIVTIAEGQVPSFLSGATGTFASIALLVLATLISLGGITVIAGGVLLIYRHSRTGRLLIAIGGGAGFIGLVFGVLYASFTQGPASIGQHLYYWVGVLLAAVSRWLAK